MKKDSMIIYRSFYEAIKELPEDARLELYEAIFELGLNYNELKLDGLSKSFFTLIKPQIEANNRKAEAGIKSGKLGAEHGKKGGRPRNEKPSKNPQDNHLKTHNETHKKPSNVNVNVNDNENNNVNDNLNVNDNYKKWDIQDFKKSITENKKSYQDLMLTKFFNYWSEKDAKGKMKFQLQKTWETSKRLATWSTNNFTPVVQDNHSYSRASRNKIL